MYDIRTESPFWLMKNGYLEPAIVEQAAEPVIPKNRQARQPTVRVLRVTKRVL